MADIYLRPLQNRDLNNRYLSWLNDPVVNQFLELRFQRWSLADLKDYVKEVKKRKEAMLAICLSSSKIHVGNVKIGNINKVHKYADIGILIGDRSCWGKGYGSQSIMEATDYAFNKLNLNKLIAGIYENNIGSFKAFLKSGYRKVGVLKKHRIFNKQYVDEILVEKNKINYL